MQKQSASGKDNGSVTRMENIHHKTQSEKLVQTDCPTFLILIPKVRLLINKEAMLDP